MLLRLLHLHHLLHDRIQPGVIEHIAVVGKPCHAAADGAQGDWRRVAARGQVGARHVAQRRCQLAALLATADQSEA